MNLITHQIQTSKAKQRNKQHTYVFQVDRKLNKLQIKKLLEQIYQITIVSLNTHIPPSKTLCKRVVVTIKSNESIDSKELLNSKENLDFKQWLGGKPKPSYQLKISQTLALSKRYFKDM